MKSIFAKQKTFIKFGLILLFAAIIYFLAPKFGLTPWFISLTAAFLLFVPGYLILKVIQWQNLSRFLDKAVASLALGLVFNFGLALLAIILGLNLKMLLIIMAVIYAALFIWAFCLDLKNNSKDQKIETKKFFSAKNLIYLLPLILAILILIAVDSQGSNFKGDPYFHLAIMEKVLAGQGLSPINLNFIKTAQIHPAYGFPIWHVFLGIIAKLTHSNSFTVWFGMAVPLTALAILVWTWLTRQIFANRFLAVAALVFFMIFTYRFQEGYLFTRLAVPDTLNQLVLLPLIIGLALKFIFDQKRNYLLLAVFTLLALLMGAIHLTQFVYFLMIVFVFGAVYAATAFKDADYKEKLIRIALALGAGLALILPFAILLETKGHVVSNTIKAYWAVDPTNLKLGYRPFKGIEALAKYAYIALPLVFLAAQKDRRFLFVFSLFLVMPLAYSQTIGVIKNFLIKLLGYIFLNRLYSNVTWDYVVWGLILGAIIIGLVYLIQLLVKKIRFGQIILNILLGALSIWLIFYQFKTDNLAKWFKASLISPKVLNFLNLNYWWLIVILALAVILCLVFFKKILAKVRLPEKVDPITFGLILAMVAFFMVSPNLKATANVFSQEFSKKKNFITVKDRSGEVVVYSRIGGKETVDFINDKIPPKSIFLTDANVIKTLPLVADQHMVAYPDSTELKKYKRVLAPETAWEDKLKYLSLSKAEYLFLAIPEKQSGPEFDSRPEYFTKIYANEIAIYKVNQEKIK